MTIGALVAAIKNQFSVSAVMVVATLILITRIFLRHPKL
jgi:hypothetical protein